MTGHEEAGLGEELAALMQDDGGVFGTLTSGSGSFAGSRKESIQTGVLPPYQAKKKKKKKVVVGYQFSRKAT